MVVCVPSACAITCNLLSNSTRDSGSGALTQDRLFVALSIPA
jgi:hypothetical protein